MTKDEIKKALECCASDSDNCNGCPYVDRINGQMFKDALNLITEQEKENDLLKMQLQDAVNHGNTFLEEANKFEAENKRLKVENKQRAADYDILYTRCTKRLKQAKIDVLTELKKQAEHCDQWNCEVIPTRYIDEMIEELKK